MVRSSKNLLCIYITEKEKSIYPVPELLPGYTVLGVAGLGFPGYRV